MILTLFMTTSNLSKSINSIKLSINTNLSLKRIFKTINFTIISLIFPLQFIRIYLCKLSNSLKKCFISKQINCIIIKTAFKTSKVSMPHNITMTQVNFSLFKKNKFMVNSFNKSSTCKTLNHNLMTHYSYITMHKLYKKSIILEEDISMSFSN